MYVSYVGGGQILCVSFFPFCIEGGMWDVIVLIPDHCLSIYFVCQNMRIIQAKPEILACSCCHSFYNKTSSKL